MSKQQHFHQGDVFVRRIAAIPSSAKTVDREAHDDPIILAHGEQTGHHHAIRSNAARQFREDGSGGGGGSFIDATGPVVLTHQEHAPIRLPAGLYEVVIQSQYTPAEIQRVVD